MRITTAEEAFALLAALPRSVGLSDAEINDLESASGVPFAADFRRLPRITGRSLGWLFPGGLDHASQIADLRREAVELFAESSWVAGPTDIVVEFFEGGCGMVFLRPNGNESRVFRFPYGNGPAGLDDTGLSLGLYLAMALERHLSATPGC